MTKSEQIMTYMVIVTTQVTGDNSLENKKRPEW